MAPWGSTHHEPSWKDRLEVWLEPFLEVLRHKAQRRWAPVYIEGLLGPGARKSVEPRAACVAPGDLQQLHHFVSASPWDPAPLEEVLVRQAGALVGGPDAVLVIDDTALVQQGQASVGVARQYCGQLGKTANCQVLVSLTLARCEVPVCVALRLFLPPAWATDAARREDVGVPVAVPARPKWQVALDQLDRVRATGTGFGCVLADAEYGKAAGFRQGLEARGLRWALGILPTQHVYPADVTAPPPRPRRPAGRASTRCRPPRAAAPPIPSPPCRTLPDDAFRMVCWRQGTKGPLSVALVAQRVRVADGPSMRDGRHLPGQAAWRVCERRAGGERKYYLTNHPEDTPLETLAAEIKARWVCEQGHQQMKEELGLDHFEGRSWRGLHHHALLTMMALCFLQYLRLGEKISGPDCAGGPASGETAPGALGAAGPAPDHRCDDPRRRAVPQMQPPCSVPPPSLKMAA